ncbi:MAG: bifunctional precorrin-2 dehydrogenase/sirohydrochlorin ferrochelatase [Dehalococcoidia bacterium]|nr:bifunctional precorrin-2 dehydrogenase/sirohydrochlorin ferrochelatase [Dehalococcoidia bacterium]
MPLYYPVFLDLRGRRVVVIGGGAMGEEKVTRLMPYGAQVVVVSPDVTDEVAGHAEDGQIEWIKRPYQRGDLEGAFITIVADTSDDAVNQAVSEEARERNVPLNVADVTHLCTWITPSVARRGEVIVATSTGGASPALARRFREILNGECRLESRHELMDFADLAPLLSEARLQLLDKGIRLNLDHWQACLTDELIDLVQAGDVGRARKVLMDSLLVGTTCDCADDVCEMYEEMAQPAPAAR